MIDPFLYLASKSSEPVGNCAAVTSINWLTMVTWLEDMWNNVKS